MKHNEFKSFIKKRLKEIADDFGHTVLSVDESNSCKIFYVLHQETLKVFKVYRCWFDAESCTIYVYNPKVKMNFCIDYYWKLSLFYTDFASLKSLFIELIGQLHKSEEEEDEDYL